MDTSEYMPMFLAEAQEHLQELNLAVVALEDDPTNQETVDGIFRIAHSLKGMSATMGFSAIAELTHVMEDVFEILRQREGGLHREAITSVLACLDGLQGAVDSIEQNGSENLDPAPLIEQLRALIRERTPDQELERSGGAIIPDPAVVAAVRADGGRILYVKTTLDPEVMMPAVRAHMVFAALNAHGEMIGSVPTPDAIENFEGYEIEAWIVTEHEEAELAKTATRVSDVASADVSELTEEQPAATATTGVDSDAEVEPEASGLDDAPAAVESSAPGAAAEAATSAAKQASAGAGHSAARTVRVDAERLDTLMHLMGELVIHRTAVEAYTANINSPELQHAVQNLTRSSQSLQSMVMQVRMIPVDVVFMRFPRLVRDLSNKLDKDIELDLVGRETELDRTVVDSLGDPLVHLVRNSLDHGIEPPDVREAAGKPRTGTLTIAARHAGGSVVIEVRDDGRGVDPEAVARKAVERGLIDAEAAKHIDAKQAIELLFAPGFSTAEVTSDISGRGVGMDAVRTKIRELGGEVLMESVPGQGTSAQIRLPLTLAIVSALQVDVSGAPFAIPLDRVERTLRLGEHTVRQIAGRRVLSLEDGVIPLLEGAATFGRAASGEHDLVVIVRGGDKRIGLTVDELVGQRELVTRPLPPVVSDGQPISGGAVLADGQIALIVDCDALATGLNGHVNRAQSSETTDPGAAALAATR
ncbi:MAG TPA: chemotaxis protein CheA [Solirubrobacteraceae bacterium]|jgi:two-component system chemotaxis sensor kinase CheA|nr:chemotaxis protein CheA [Solirubrobacteraceae bacterium]